MSSDENRSNAMSELRHGFVVLPHRKRHYDVKPF